MAKLPPYAALLGLQPIRDGDRTLFAMPFAEAVIGRPGFVHGGAIAGLLEFAGFQALRDALGEEEARMKPIGISIDFLRGAGQAETRAAGLVRRMGRRVANVEATAWQEDEAKPIAIARMNVLLRR